jgi:hypothetical protein
MFDGILGHAPVPAGFLEVVVGHFVWWFVAGYGGASSRTWQRAA